MTFSALLLDAARATLGVHEDGGKNRGPHVDAWNTMAGAPLGSAWCASWVYAMHQAAADALHGVPNPCPRTAGALKLWQLAPVEARRQLPAPGDVFVLDTGDPGGFGHVGIVESCSPAGDTVTTIEGNTNDAGSREGNAVARHTWKPKDGHRGALVGYLAFG